MPAQLPQFENPPAIETVMGFYFTPPQGWSVLRLGQACALYQEAYPTANVTPPIPAPNNDPQTLIVNTDQVPIRAMLSTDSGSELLQIQSSAFFRNWRQTAENKSYSHYVQLKPKFSGDWKTFCRFLDENKLSPPSVYQCEVTYVNHLIRGIDWTSYSDLAKMIKLFSVRSEIDSSGRIYSYLPEAGNVALSVGYPVADGGLTLQIQAQSAITVPEGSEVLQLTITGRGAPSESSHTHLMEYLDRCHDAVIMAFDDVTTELAHKRWGKK